MQEVNHLTPHLTIAMTGCLNLLEKTFLANQEAIENWFKSQWQLSPPPFYGSVDLRNAGFKLAPVDMNLFPAGFNNLNEAFFPLLVDAAKVALNQPFPNAKKVLLIPESHTRNEFYWKNVQQLKRILQAAEFDVRIGVLEPVADEALIQRKGNKIELENFVPDVILLNNDLSAGIPDVLQQIEQPVIPPAELGWSQRLKSDHFQYYASVSAEFSELIQIDPWLIAPLFKHCGEIDFMNRSSEDCLTEKVEQLFGEIEKKYKEYAIPCKPFIIMKADAGTYGMAVMTVRDLDEVRLLNRKQRTTMSKTKGGRPVQKIIIQEGVYTFETIGKDQAVAEPVVYLVGQQVVGGFYRVHKERGVDENLNSPGMRFEPLAFAESCHRPEANNRFYIYGVVARLSMLAAAREIVEQKAQMK